MQETPQEYTARILSYQQGSDAMKLLASSPGKIGKLLKGATKKALSKRPEPDKWSVAELLGHLADAELVYGFRMRLILGANGTPVQAYDQDRWLGFSQYGKQDPWLSYEAYRIQRERNLRLLRLLPPEMLEYFGMHEERGKETVARLTAMIAGHDINHMRQIEQILGARRPRKKPQHRKRAARSAR